MTGTASSGGREYWKEAAFFNTAMKCRVDSAINCRVDSIPAGWYIQEVLEVPSVAVAGSCIIYQSIYEDES
jgi:hypothetical protein